MSNVTTIYLPCIPLPVGSVLGHLLFIMYTTPHIVRLSAIVFDGLRLHILCATGLQPVHDDNAIFESDNLG